MPETAEDALPVDEPELDRSDGPVGERRDLRDLVDGDRSREGMFGCLGIGHGYDPDRPDAILPPPVLVGPDGQPLPVYTGADLKTAVDDAAAQVAIVTPAHRINPDGWVLRWGTQNDAKVVTTGLPGAEMTERHVAGYLAKYATKSTEAAGITAGRVNEETIQA